MAEFKFVRFNEHCTKEFNNICETTLVKHKIVNDNTIKELQDALDKLLFPTDNLAFWNAVDMFMELYKAGLTHSIYKCDKKYLICFTTGSQICKTLDIMGLVTINFRRTHYIVSQIKEQRKVYSSSVKQSPQKQCVNLTSSISGKSWADMALDGDSED